MRVRPADGRTATTRKNARSAGASEWAHLGLKSAEADRPGVTWDDFRTLLQGLLVDAEGRPIALDTTGFHSALGQIRDKILASGELQRLAELLLRELGDR
jgi:hypothetical protein